MKATPKLIVFHPSLYKPSSSTSSTHRLWLLAFFTLFTFTFLITLLKSTPPPLPPSSTAALPHLSNTISAALLHYATSAAANTTATTTADRMTAAELTAVATTIRQCSPHCNLLIFGFTHETLLWKSLNSGERRRTVFLDENEYVVSKYEQNFTDIEAYDVQYTTKVSKWEELIHYGRVHRKDECRPVQNLLFSECKLAVNDLPNHLYEIPWDIILIDGPRGYSPKMPGRMAAIFSAAVMAWTRTQTQTQTRIPGQQQHTHVFVHDYGRDVERVYSEEFLCKENLVEIKDSLAHFTVKVKEEKDDDDDRKFEFCAGDNSSSSSSTL